MSDSVLESDISVKNVAAERPSLMEHTYYGRGALMPDAKTLAKIGAFTGIGTGTACLVDGPIWDPLPLNAVACVFLGFAETLGCMQTSFPIAGELVPPMTLNGIDLFIIFTAGIAATFCLSWFCDLLTKKIRVQRESRSHRLFPIRDSSASR